MRLQAHKKQCGKRPPLGDTARGEGMCVGGEIERYPGARSWWWCVGAHGVSYKGCGVPYQILLMLNNVVVKYETDSETTDDAL